jgi:hypothetical protein
VVVDELRRAMAVVIDRARIGGGRKPERGEQRSGGEHVNGLQSGSPMWSGRRTLSGFKAAMLRAACRPIASSPLRFVSSADVRRC